MGRAAGYFVEIGCFQKNKNGNIVCGDTFLSKKVKEKNRYIAVLSDGLGSGIKASVLSTMTASMALNFRMHNDPIQRTAENIMKTLPVDSLRGISYSTFTIVDVDADGEVRIAEYDNPFILLRNGKAIAPQRTKVEIEDTNKCGNLYVSHFHMEKDDRIVVFSDGVTQSGMGNKEMPFGWGEEGVARYLEKIVNEDSDMSARGLARKVVLRAEFNDLLKLKDDTSCAVIYLRAPRKLLVCTGPPFKKERDKQLAEILDSYNGKKIICGGSTSKIIARELNAEISVDLSVDKSGLPPSSKMEGVDLITEGILTLGSVEKILDKGASEDMNETGPAYEIVRMFMQSDIIDFVVGTKVNEAHQDPALPVELEIRRNVIKRICYLLEDKYLKQVNTQFI